MTHLEKLEKLFEQSHFLEGLEVIETLEAQYSTDFQLLLPYRIKKIAFLEKLERFEEGLKLADELLSQTVIRISNLQRIDIIIQKIKLLFSMGNLNKVLKYIEIAEPLIFQEEYQENEYLMEKMADLVLFRGGYYWQNGDLDNALYYFKFNAQIRKNLTNKLKLANSYNNIGVLYNAKGNLIQALQFLKDAYEIYKKINSKRGISQTGNNIGAILLQLGDLDESLRYMKRSLAIDVQTNYDDGIRVASQNIGEVYWHKKQYAQAMRYLKSGLIICEKHDNLPQIADILVPMVYICFETGNRNELERYLKKMEKIHNQTDNLLIQQRYHLTQALYYRLLDTPDALENAITHLTEIIRDKIRYHDLTIMALVNYCEVLIEKLSKTNQLSLQNILNTHIQQLITIAEDSKSYTILANAYLLKSKFLYANFDYKGAQKMLIEAHQITIDHHLKRLEYKILNEYDILLAQTDQDTKRTGSHSFHKDQQQLRYKMIQHQLRSLITPEYVDNLDKVSDKPYYFGIFTHAGIKIVDVKFSSQWQTNSIFTEVFEVELYKYLKQFLHEALDMAKIGAYQVIFKRYHQFFIVYAYSGSSYAAFQKIHTFTANLDKKKKQNHRCYHTLSRVRYPDHLQQEKLRKWITQLLYLFAA